MLMSLHFLHNLLSRRKKIGLLATKKWDDKLPKFNSPESKAELKEFAEQISPECGIPEINFTEEGIAQHIKTFFTEQRRYRKSKNPALNRVCVSIKFYNNFQHGKFFERKLSYCLIIFSQRSYLCLYVRKTTHNLDWTKHWNCCSVNNIPKTM